jgi:hypothetical protein
MAPLDRPGIDCQGNTRPFRELFDNVVPLNRRFINHRSSRSVSRQRASFTTELKLSILEEGTAAACERAIEYVSAREPSVLKDDPFLGQERGFDVRRR